MDALIVICFIIGLEQGWQREAHEAKQSKEYFEQSEVWKRPAFAYRVEYNDGIQQRMVMSCGAILGLIHFLFYRPEKWAWSNAAFSLFVPIGAGAFACIIARWLFRARERMR